MDAKFSNKKIDSSYHPYNRSNSNQKNDRSNNYNLNNRNNSSYGQSNPFVNRAYNMQKTAILSPNEAELHIHPYSKFDQPFPEFKRPSEIGVLISESNANI